MKKITLYRNQKSKLSHNFIQVTTFLKQYEYNYNEASFEERINNHNINLFFVTDDTAKTYLETKKHYFKLGFSNFLILQSENDIDEINTSYSFKQIYLEIPSFNQMNIDLMQANQASLENIKQHIKVYFTGYLLESIIHELNNPLTSVTLNIQLLLEMCENKMTFKEGQLEEFLNQSLKSVTNSSQITKNVMRYASFNSDENDYFNLTDILKNVYLFTGPIFRKKHLNLILPEKEDYLVYANNSDINLLVVILFYLYAKSTEERESITISYKNNSVVISSPINLDKMEDLYSGLFIPAFYVDLTIQEIIHRNQILPIIENNTLVLTLPQTENA